MNPKKTLLVCAVAALLAAPAMARNDRLLLTWQDVLDSAEGKSAIDNNIKLMFGSRSAPAGSERKGEAEINRIAKSRDGGGDSASCRLAAAQALAELQAKARAMDADAVVDIVSYYKATTFDSATQYECHAGGTGGHLTFKAVFVKLKK